jgi:hypothetical protein
MVQFKGVRKLENVQIHIGSSLQVRTTAGMAQTPHEDNKDDNYIY